MRSPHQVMPILTDDDDRNDVIGRRRFARVGWPKHRERVGSEDRQYDHRYHQRNVRFHAKKSTDAFNRLPWRVRGIFRCYRRADWDSLIRGKRLSSRQRSRGRIA
jgi:hypothetical protein